MRTPASMRSIALGAALAAALAASLAACKAPIARLNPTRPAGTAPAQGNLAIPARATGAGKPFIHGQGAGYSDVQVTIRWPERTTQAIPQSAARIELAAYREGATTPARTVAADRPAGNQSSTSTLALDKVRVGTYQFTATARDGQGKIVASGNAPGALLPNQLVRVNLTLFTTDAPAVTGLGAEAAAPGQRVAVFGRAFGEAAGNPVSVSIGGMTVPDTDVERVTDSLLVLTVPAGAGNGRVKVSTGGLEASSVADLKVIARLEASPSIALTHQPSGRARFAVQAFDAGNATVSVAAVEWRITSMECEESGVPCLDVAVPGAAFGSFDAADDEIGEQVGTASIRIGSALVNTDVKVVTHVLAPADLRAGMGPLGPAPFPADNEPTQARSDLGRKLFFDPKLSGSGEMSCSTCHLPEKGFADGRRLSPGNDGKDLARHTPTALNAAYSPVQFWDGRAASLEEQAMGVITSAREFNSDIPALVAHVTSQYGDEFQAAYGAAPTTALVTKAIASFERKVVVSGDSPFDKWARGQDDALSVPAKIGLGKFLGSSGCVACHSGANFSDGKFHNIGIPGSGTTDTGRFGITSAPSDRGAFKTPTLRNVSLTAPYFHDGSKATLADAIRFYENFDADFPNLDKDLTRSNFSEEMLAFLEALTSPVATP